MNLEVSEIHDALRRPIGNLPDFKYSEYDTSIIELSKKIGIKSEVTIEIMIAIRITRDEKCEMSIENIAKNCLSTRDCSCLDGVPVPNRIRVLSYILEHLHCPTDCYFLVAVNEYLVHSSVFPNDEDLRAYIMHRNILTIATSIGIRCEMSQSLMRMIQDLIERGCQITIEQIARRWCMSVECPCLNHIPPFDCFRIVCHLLHELGCIQCDSIVATYEYFVLENVLPNRQEFERFIDRRNRLERGPDAYCNDEKMDIPTPGLQNIQSSRLTEAGFVCSICTDEMSVGTSVFKLPQCGHYFHASEESCLGKDAFIITWLKKSRLCPNCNTNISIEGQ